MMSENWSHLLDYLMPRILKINNHWNFQILFLFFLVIVITYLLYKEI
ncbi:hypothetical protein BACFRA24663_16835 [Bacteroides fragilis]